MSNVLQVFWKQIFGDDDDDEKRPQLRWRARLGSGDQASATIFVIMRRMRAPLIILIVIFAVSVLGLVLIPGEDPAGLPYHMSFFDAFYFMSYTASTIGFGELPFPFTDNQRMWVTISIYLTVIGWAYAIGSLLTLIQDRAFRNALALQRFSRKVRRLREPFLLFAGYGQTGRTAREVVRSTGPAVRRHRPVRRPHRFAGSGRLPRRHPRPGRRCPQSAPSRGGRSRPPVLLRRGRADQRRRGEPGGHHGGGAAATGTAGDRPHGLPGDRGPDACLRHAVGGQSVRPVRRPPAAGAALPGVLPAADLAGERSGRRATQTRPAADRGQVGAVRVRAVREGDGSRSPGRGARADHHRTDRQGRPGPGHRRRRRI